MDEHDFLISATEWIVKCESQSVRAATLISVAWPSSGQLAESDRRALRLVIGAQSTARRSSALGSEKRTLFRQQAANTGYRLYEPSMMHGPSFGVVALCTTVTGVWVPHAITLPAGASRNVGGSRVPDSSAGSVVRHPSARAPLEHRRHAGRAPSAWLSLLRWAGLAVLLWITLSKALLLRLLRQLVVSENPEQCLELDGEAGHQRIAAGNRFERRRQSWHQRVVLDHPGGRLARPAGLEPAALSFEG